MCAGQDGQVGLGESSEQPAPTGVGPAKWKEQIKPNQEKIMPTNPSIPRESSARSLHL